MTDRDELERARDLLLSAVPQPVPSGYGPPKRVLDLDTPHLELRALGLELLAAGRVAMLTLAGGRSTRMGGRFRGDLPVGPVSGRTLLEIHGERIGAIRARYAPGLRWLVMTSEAVRDQTTRAIDRAGRFGFDRNALWLFDQPSLPVLDEDLEPVRAPDGTLLRSPTGHGAMPEVLRTHGHIERLRALGVDHLFVSQYPNALEKSCDPVMIGHHHSESRAVTIKTVRETHPTEPVGRLADSAGRLMVIDYHAQARPTEQLTRLPMATGTYLYSLDFLAALPRPLPHRVVPHQEPGIPYPLRKTEQLTSDLLSISPSTAAVAGARRHEYAPVKSTIGTDTVATARAALTAQYRSWLDAAGARPLAEIRRIEISAWFALGPDELANALPASFEFNDRLLLAGPPSR